MFIIQWHGSANHGSANYEILDLGLAPYVLYDVKYIDLVSLAPFPSQLITVINENGVQATAGFEMCFAMHTPKTSALS